MPKIFASKIPRPRNCSIPPWNSFERKESRISKSGTVPDHYLLRGLLLPIIALISLAAGSVFSKSSPENDPWQKFLTRYVDTTAADGINRVRYSDVTQEDESSLQDYLRTRQSEPVSTWEKADQRAFWINLYNAQTVAVILEHHPVKSIREIKLPGSASAGPWDAKLLSVEGRTLSLNDIENSILRKQWKDPRIHFALNCGSLGCPNLSHRVFTAANTETQLKIGAEQFLQSARGVDFTGGQLVLSSIFDWYRTDFGANEKAVLETISKLAGAESGVSAKLRGWTGKVGYAYDWDLNKAILKK